MIKSFRQTIILYERGDLWQLKPWSRHSLVLMVAGIGYVCIGISYVLAEPNPMRDIALQYALNYFSLQTWGVWFIVTGLITMVSARWPPVDRIWGYELLTGLASAWSLFYLFGIIWGEAPINYVSSVVVWGIFAFLWWAISGLRDTVSNHGHI